MEVFTVKGLTLIELMISIALLTIILSTAGPGFSSLIERHQSNTAITSLKRLLTHSRALALQKEISVTACPTENSQCINNWNAPITAFSDLNNNQTIDRGETSYFTTQIKNTTGYWQKKRVNTPLVKFNPQGHAFSSATTFLYCPHSSQSRLAKQLVINFQGRIRVNHYLSETGTPYANLAPLTCNSE